ncbi:RHS repeat-associated core domain-containing protein [Pseudomonas sp. CDFA 610]|uniref:RHS repeat-associated core domain-containing protein n=1 Tax=Pseudomonas sp. CDFA 610 TaxID=2829825 RepID=UPI001E503386|nr:RHS repeat-associated core domain-containing protein [Pseudomonas sp. CDFA 610]MCD5985477.1 RHS repeat-associated core domain-containing protein [Pseudomonas sp. CDFA 610]
MTSIDSTLLCRYRYDPVDRLASTSRTDQDTAQHFYIKNHSTMQIQGQHRNRQLHVDGYLLAQQNQQDHQARVTLLASDQQRSIITIPGARVSYTPYGNSNSSTIPPDLPSFTGQHADLVTGHYLLGNGYRAFNPVLMRFNSPDSLSPLGEGGFNAYVYCFGDPVNCVDEDGHLKTRVLASIFKGLRPSPTIRNKLSITRHASVLPPKSDLDVKTLAGMIQGNVTNNVSERVRKVKSRVRVVSTKDGRLIMKKPKHYIRRLKQAGTFSEPEQRAIQLQMRPLPPAPDGRWLGPRPSLKRTNETHAYEQDSSEYLQDATEVMSSAMPPKKRKDILYIEIENETARIRGSNQAVTPGDSNS